MSNESEDVEMVESDPPPSSETSTSDILPTSPSTTTASQPTNTSSSPQQTPAVVDDVVPDKPEPVVPAAEVDSAPAAPVKQESPVAVKPEPVAVKPEPLNNDNTTVQAILAFLKKNNLTGTEELLKTELAKASGGSGGVSGSVSAPDNEMGNALATYKSDGDPSTYDDAYNDLELFIENSLDLYKHELALILYPVFVHMYLELVYNQHEQAAIDFIAKFGPRQESYYQEDIKKLSFVTKKEHMKGNELMENFNTSQFTVRMSRDTYTQLRQQKKHLSEKKHTLLWNVIQEHLYLDVYEGMSS